MHYGIAAIVLCIVVLASAGVFYFYNNKQAGEEYQKQTSAQGEQTTEKTTPTLQELSLEITQVKLCKFIDDSYNCDEIQNGLFNRGEAVYILADVVNIKQIRQDKGWLIGVKSSIKTLDPRHKIVLSLTGTVSDSADYLREEIKLLHLKNRLQTTKEFMPGKYTSTIIVYDKLSKKSVSREVAFELR